MTEKRFNFGVPDQEVEDRWVVWWDQPNDKHTWAFIYYCKRKGDKVYVKGDRRTVHVGLKRRQEDR